MKDIGFELKRIIEDRRLVKKKLADKIGMDPSYLGVLLGKSDMSCSKLEQICKGVGISPSYFFDDDSCDGIKTGDIRNSSFAGSATVNVGGNGSNVRYLEELLEEKERMIKVLLRQLGMDEDVVRP